MLGTVGTVGTVNTNDNVREQDGSGGIGDADVEPPSRGAREDQEDLAEVRER